MSKHTVSNDTVKQGSPPADSGTQPAHPGALAAPHHGKSGVDKTQSLLTIVSTAIGIMGAVGTAAVWLASTFYVGHLELKTEKELPGMSVKVYTKDGQESVFHTKWIDLMPGKYHIEVIPPKGESHHQDIDVQFNKTNTVRVLFPEEVKTDTSAASASTPEEKKKKRWYQFWKSGKKDSNASSVEETNTPLENLNRGFGIGDGFLEQPPVENAQTTDGGTESPARESDTTEKESSAR